MWALREREEGCCGQKIAYFLERERHVKLSVPAVYAVLAERYMLRSKGKRRNIKRGAEPEAIQPRQVAQMDTVPFGAVYAFTAVNICTHEADVYLSSTLTASSGALFLAQCMPRRYNDFAERIQADATAAVSSRPSSPRCCPHGATGTGSPDLTRKIEQSCIESFNRTLRSECLGWMRYKAEQIAGMTDKVKQFLARYHYHRSPPRF